MPPDPGADLLADRYGKVRRRRRGPLAASVAVGVAFAGWLVWATAFHSTPEVRSQLTGYEIIGENAALGRVDVRLGDDVDASEVACLLRATAYDHTTVGELRFSPRSGPSEHTVRTAREATSVELIGCTTPEQPRPR